MAELQVIARHTMKQGREEEVLGLLPSLVAAARAEPGCLAFNAYLQLDNPSTYVLLERYASPEALADHRETAHFKGLLLDQIVPRLDSRTVEEYEVPVTT